MNNTSTLTTNLQPILAEVKDTIIALEGLPSYTILDIDIAIKSIKELYQKLVVLRKGLEYDLLTELEPIEEATPVPTFLENIQPKDEVQEENTPPVIEKDSPTINENTAIEEIETNAPAEEKNAVFEQAKSLYGEYVTSPESDTEKITPITDIKTAITIQDKFLYLKQLFNNNIQAYNESIEKLNTCENSDDAGVFFIELANKYNWNLEQGDPCVLKLFSLVEQRYASK